jgi:uncharacterized protein (TIGR03086 family)
MTKDLHNEMSAALAEAARVVAGVPQDADLSGPTLCTDWDLRTLLNHTILWTSYSAERRAQGESVSEDLMNKDFTADPGFRDDYAQQAGRAAQAWSAPSAWEGELSVMGNATPAADVGAMLLMETVLHGWDVAAATGQKYRLDDAVARATLEVVQAQAEMFRKYQGFADEVQVSDEAPALDRALALAGRDPARNPAG